MPSVYALYNMAIPCRASSLSTLKFVTSLLTLYIESLRSMCLAK